jgi:hypothetical protein
MIQALANSAEETLPLGRSLIRLTVDRSPVSGTGDPPRGYRRIGWIEQALDPLRGRLAPPSFERLVSMLAIAIGWEARIVLTDLRQVPTDEQFHLMMSMAKTLIDAALAESK